MRHHGDIETLVWRTAAKTRGGSRNNTSWCNLLYSHLRWQWTWFGWPSEHNNCTEETLSINHPAGYAWDQISRSVITEAAACPCTCVTADAPVGGRNGNSWNSVTQPTSPTFPLALGFPSGPFFCQSNTPHLSVQTEEVRRGIIHH